MDTSSIDHSGIEGTWHPVRAEHEGQLAPDLALLKTRMTFADGRYCTRFGTEPSDEGTYEISREETGARLTLKSLKGVNAGRTIPAIFQRRGDRLRVCYGMNGALPTEFTAGLSSSRYLVTYKRAEVQD
ncbi:MAG TPA: TIGR03067 domain-containing protein [Opitutaceae bacterium]|nr:TIGR03067 domain-containing protein [Opitutaceae bacterium]